MNVLIVEPSRTVVHRLSGLFRRYGIEPRVARNGREGLMRLREAPASLLCFTYELGDMDGIDFFECAKAEGLVRCAPGLMFSSTEDYGVLRRALLAGVDSHFPKKRVKALERFVERFANRVRIDVESNPEP